MKNVAKCDTWCELRNPVNHRVFERKSRPKPLGRGHARPGVTHPSPPHLPPLGREAERGRTLASRGRPARGWPEIGPAATYATTSGGFRTARRRASRRLGAPHENGPRPRSRPQCQRDHPPSLSISISGGKETYKDSPSNGERTGRAQLENRRPRRPNRSPGEASQPADRAQVPRKGAPERVRAPSCPDPVAPRGARLASSGCLGMQPQSGGKFRPRLNTARDR